MKPDVSGPDEIVRRVVFLMLVMVLTHGAAAVFGSEKSIPGLVGGQYGSEDFSELQNLSRLTDLEGAFGEDDDYGRQWAGRWVGFVVAPADGEITFIAESDQALQVRVAGKTIIDLQKGAVSGSPTMIKGRAYPIEVTYVKTGQSYDCWFEVQWSWPGQDAVSISTANLYHTDQQEQE
ncbi:MAG: PA14 domain-containing protein, partial [Planctomycetota bacterium]